MSRWEYCEVWWEPNQITVNICNVGGSQEEKYESAEWFNVLAKLGDEGWELTGVLASPSGSQQYWYYFKRPMD